MTTSKNTAERVDIPSLDEIMNVIEIASSGVQSEIITMMMGMNKKQLDSVHRFCSSITIEPDPYNGQGTCDEALKRMQRKAEKGLA